MSKKTRTTTAAILTAAIAIAQNAQAHMEPQSASHEMCYGVVKAGKNDCASRANKHDCSGKAMVDNDPNEWIKLPSGTCEKLIGGSTVPKAK